MVSATDPAPPKWHFAALGFFCFLGETKLALSLSKCLSSRRYPGKERRDLREPLGNPVMDFKSYNFFMAVVVSLRKLIDELKIIIDEHQ